MAVSFVVFGCFAVIFGIYDVVWVWDPRYNSTVAIYQYNGFSTQHSATLFAYYNLSGTLWPLVSLIVIVISAVIISDKLRQASKFRSQYQSGGAGNNKTDPTGTDPAAQKMKQFASRDQKVVKNAALSHHCLVHCRPQPRVTSRTPAQCFIAKYYYNRYCNLASPLLLLSFSLIFSTWYSRTVLSFLIWVVLHSRPYNYITYKTTQFNVNNNNNVCSIQFYFEFQKKNQIYLNLLFIK
ncbi:hypothetical protein Btru_056120 [Bulinus truncatus]|nr:hypothetical protein Btru_056120 [Bulinus truncatus]